MRLCISKIIVTLDNKFQIPHYSACCIHVKMQQNTIFTWHKICSQIGDSVPICSNSKDFTKAVPFKNILKWFQLKQISPKSEESQFWINQNLNPHFILNREPLRDLPMKEKVPLGYCMNLDPGLIFFINIFSLASGLAIRGLRWSEGSNSGWFRIDFPHI